MLVDRQIKGAQMVSKKTLETLKNIGDKNYFFIVKAIDAMNKPRAIQRAINKYNNADTVEVDGIIGPGTIREMIKIDDDEFTDVLFDILYNDKVEVESPNSVGSKEALIQYLKSAEGGHVHWNKTESDFTTPGGVYAKLFPRSEPVVYVRKLAKKYDVNLRHRNLNQLAKLNNSMTKEEKRILWDKVYDFVTDKFIDKRVIDYLDANELLVYFSLALNGGLSRGNKALQTAIGVKADGKIGKGTLKALQNGMDKDLIPGMLDYMQKFYDYLTTKNPKKYGMYKKGWHNRLVHLAKITNTNWR
jgi:lysozyme family protein